MRSAREPGFLVPSLVIVSLLSILLFVSVICRPTPEPRPRDSRAVRPGVVAVPAPAQPELGKRGPEASEDPVSGEVVPGPEDEGEDDPEDEFTHPGYRLHVRSFVTGEELTGVTVFGPRGKPPACLVHPGQTRGSAIAEDVSSPVFLRDWEVDWADTLIGAEGMQWQRFRFRAKHEEIENATGPLERVVILVPGGNLRVIVRGDPGARVQVDLGDVTEEGLASFRPLAKAAAGNRVFASLRGICGEPIEFEGLPPGRFGVKVVTRRADPVAKAGATVDIHEGSWTELSLDLVPGRKRETEGMTSKRPVPEPKEEPVLVEVRGEIVLPTGLVRDAVLVVSSWEGFRSETMTLHTEEMVRRTRDPGRLEWSLELEEGPYDFALSVPGSSWSIQEQGVSVRRPIRTSRP